MIKETLQQISDNFLNLSENHSEIIENTSKLIITALKNNATIFFCGNGGSAADAQHLAAELVGKYKKIREPLKAIALTTDTSILTAVANDFSFKEIFSRQIYALAKENDVLYAISTSGNSENIIEAIAAARIKKIKVVGITGKDGGMMNNVCDILIKVPSESADRIQEMHIAIGQIICENIENSLC